MLRFAIKFKKSGNLLNFVEWWREFPNKSLQHFPPIIVNIFTLLFNLHFLLLFFSNNLLCVASE